MTKARVESRGQGNIGLELVSHMDTMTTHRIGELGKRNAYANQKYLKCGKSLRDLRDQKIGMGNNAIVIAAGPSVKRKNAASQIKENQYKGAIIATESAMSYCLRNGILPDLVTTLDPHATRIVRWFGDPKLDEATLREDDYFSRQDLDQNFSDQLKANQEMIELLGRFGKGMKIALATSASQAVVERVLEIGMEVYWWNPMFDDPDSPQSVTRELFEMNGLPCVNAGGNVGTASWMMAHAVLEKKRVALVGVDFSYYDETPYQNTQYYHEIVNLVGKDRLDEVFIRVFNPHLQIWFYTDPAYMWYRQVFLEMAQDVNCKTYNCTEGGILFGEHVEFVPLKQFLEDGQSG